MSALDLDTFPLLPSTWRSRLTEWAAIFCMWTIFIALSVGRIFLDPDRATDSPDPQTAAVFGRVLYYYGWAFMTPVIFWMCERLGIDGPRPAWQRVLLHVIAAFATAVAFDTYGDLLFGYIFDVWGEAQRPASVWASFQKSMRDVLVIGFLYDLIIYLMILAIGFARAYYRRLQARRMQATKLRAQLTEARLSALRMQMNPHFLFNTLNAVSSMVERDPKGVRRMVARLSALLRHTLAQGDQQEVTLDDELRLLDDYLAVMRVRFGDRLEVNRSIEDGVGRAMVPDMIMQPIVENAIKHGIAPQEDGGRICLFAARRSDYLVLRVEDDGPGLDGFPEAGDGSPTTHLLDRQPSSGGIGLTNVRERLEQLYGPDHRMSIRSGRDGGLVVEMWIPYHETDYSLDETRDRILQVSP